MLRDAAAPAGRPAGAAQAEGATHLHHGDCAGVDAQAARIARRLGYRIVAHPPSDPRLVQLDVGADEERPPAPYLKRNANIVAEAGLLVALPRDPEDVSPRSRTWATVRMARRAGISLEMILP